MLTYIVLTDFLALFPLISYFITIIEDVDVIYFILMNIEMFNLFIIIN